MDLLICRFHFMDGNVYNGFQDGLIIKNLIKTEEKKLTIYIIMFMASLFDCFTFDSKKNF